jgi:starch phosphorylase
MSVLTPAFASNRMMRDYIEKAWLPLAGALRARTADDSRLGKQLCKWADTLRGHWQSLHIGQPAIAQNHDHWRFSVPVFLGEIAPDWVRVELFADEKASSPAEVVQLHREQRIPGAAHGYVYAGDVSGARRAEDYTLRIVPYHEAAFIPSEFPLIAWQR